jgi:hypothetical protein
VDTGSALVFTLTQHGDREERAAWPLFLRYEFPEYAEFWRLFIVVLTGRVHDVRAIGFRPQEELDAEGRPDWHVEVAQLHYTTLLHLARVFDLRQRRIRDRDSFLEAIVRLDAATDTAFELLGRCLIDAGASPAWNEDAGKKVRQKWQDEAGGPFKSLAAYRNSLLHGRVRPEHEVTLQGDGWETKVPFYPTFASMGTALDWRQANLADAAPADQLVNEEWEHVLAYLRDTWAKELVPWARATFTEPVPPPATSRIINLVLGGAPSASAAAPPTTSGSIAFSETITELTDLSE